MIKLKSTVVGVLEAKSVGLKWFFGEVKAVSKEVYANQEIQKLISFGLLQKL